MQTIKERYLLARERYFRGHPSEQAEINAIDPSVFTGIGLSLEEGREQKRTEFFARAAKRLGIDAHELVIRLVATSELEAQEWRLAHHRDIADSLGMDWQEYQRLNGIAEG